MSHCRERPNTMKRYCACMPLTFLKKKDLHKVLAAADAEAALRILKARPNVRLPFTDIQMPGVAMEWI